MLTKLALTLKKSNGFQKNSPTYSVEKSPLFSVFFKTMDPKTDTLKNFELSSPSDIFHGTTPNPISAKEELDLLRSINSTYNFLEEILNPIPALSKAAAVHLLKKGLQELENDVQKDILQGWLKRFEIFEECKGYCEKLGIPTEKLGNTNFTTTVSISALKSATELCIEQIDEQITDDNKLAGNDNIVLTDLHGTPFAERIVERKSVVESVLEGRTANSDKSRTIC